MSENVYWVLEFAVDPHRFKELETLNAELVEATRKNEAGMLDNHWAISEDRQVCHIYERFQDSAALMSHLQWFGPNFGERFMKILKPTRVLVYGAPSEEVKNAIAEFNPIYMAPLGGFRR